VEHISESERRAGGCGRRGSIGDHSEIRWGIESLGNNISEKNDESGVPWGDGVGICEGQEMEEVDAGIIVVVRMMSGEMERIVSGLRYQGSTGD
jgi:hypothetical protein